LDTKDLPITYANVNTTQHKLVHRYIGPNQTLQTLGNTVKPDTPNDITIYDTVPVSRVKLDHTDDSKVARPPPPLQVQTSCTGTRYVVESIPKYHTHSAGTSWEYELKWEDWDENDNTCEPEEIMAKAKEMVKKY
jgi:hypothetical protein